MRFKNSRIILIYLIAIASIILVLYSLFFDFDRVNIIVGLLVFTSVILTYRSNRYKNL